MEQEQHRENTWTEKLSNQVSSWFYAEKNEPKSIFHQYTKSIAFYSDISNEKLLDLVSYTVEKTSNCSLAIWQLGSYYISESLSNGSVILYDMYGIVGRCIQRWRATLKDSLNDIANKFPFSAKVFSLSESPMIFTLVLTFILMFYVYLVYLTLSYLFRNIKKKHSTTRKYNNTDSNLRIKDKNLRIKEYDLHFKKRTQGIKRQQIICWKVFILVISVFFFISIPWEFIRLYQQGVAEKAALSIQGIPPECLPGEMSNYEYLKSWFTWQYSWNPNPCEVYHKAVLVDPLWEVTPLMVLSSVLTRCISKPIELLCATVGRCFRLMFSEIPAQWQPVLMLLVILMTIMSVLMCCRYRLHLPLLFNFEPSKPEPIKICSKRNMQSHPPFKSTKNSGNPNHSCETVANFSNNSSIEWNTSGESDCFIVE